MRLVGELGRKKQGTKANYKICNSEENGANGLRVKLTFCMSAAGRHAPIMVSVAGLSEEDLPKKTCPSGILLLKIEGLCPGQGNDYGYLCLVRNNNDGETDLN